MEIRITVNQKKRPLLRLKFFFILLLGVMAPVLDAQVPPATPALGAGAATSRSQWTPQQVQERIKQLEATANVEDTAKSKQLEIYRNILNRLEDARTYADNLEVFRKAIETAPAEVQQIRETLRAAEKTPIDPNLPDLPSDATAEQLQQRLTQEQAVLADLKSRHEKLESQIQDELDRPAKARIQLTDAKQKLADVEKELGLAPPVGEETELVELRRGLLEARKNARTLEIQMLDQEILSNAARVELITANRDLLGHEIAVQEARMTRLNGLLSQSRKEETEKARRDAALLLQEAVGKHPVLQQLATNITEIAREAAPITTKLDETKRTLDRVDEQLTEVRADFDEARKTLELVGLSESLGAVLRVQRADLPKLRQLQRQLEDRAERTSEIRLRLLKIDRELKPRELEREKEKLLRSVNRGAMTPEEREEFDRELEALLLNKRDQLERLARSNRAYLNELGALDAKQRELLEKSEEFAAFVDERLLWLRSTTLIGRDLGLGLASSLSWLFSPERWQEVGLTLVDDFYTNPLPGLAWIIVLIGLVVMRGKLLERLHKAAEGMSRKYTDRFSYTWIALVVTLLLLLPIPLAAGFISWRLLASPLATDFARSIGFGLAQATLFYSVAEFLRVLCRPQGLGHAHFHWPERPALVLRTHLRWFAPVAVAAVFLIGVFEGQGDDLEQYRNSLGRLTFILTMIAQAAFTFLVLRRRGGIAEELLRNKDKSMTARTFGLWYPAALILPLVFATLAATGYYYTAWMLEGHFLLTVMLVLGAVLLHALVCRWLIVSQTKLAMKLALEKRRSKVRIEEGQEPDAAKVAAKENLDEIDVEEIQEQTLELLRAFVGLLLVVGCWLVWAEVLPALGILNDVTIWHRMVVVEGQETFEPVTLASLGLAILFAGLTILSAKNLPGFLEIAVLQRLRVEAGTRYATRTISNYMIVAIGIVLVCNTLGIGWPSVQWLVAALSVGLGFGLQEIFANFVSGLIILVERPVRVGDTVTVGQISGVVTRIKMRATTITDWNRKELIVPNKSFITSELINWSLSDPILRMDFIVGLEYGSNTTLAHQVMVQVAKDHPMVLEKPEPTVFFKDFGDNSLNFEVRVFVSEATNTGRTRIVHDLHMAIDQAFRERGIVIAFPQRDLHLKTADAVIRVSHVHEPPASLPKEGDAKNTK